MITKGINVKILTGKDPCEYREIQKQISIRRKQAASKFSKLSCFHELPSILVIIKKKNEKEKEYGKDRIGGNIMIIIVYLSVSCVNVINFQLKSVAF